MTGVVLAGGTASRLRPLTAGVNKHLLPLGREPMVCRALRTLHAAGVGRLVVVTGREHLAAFSQIDSRALGLGEVFLVDQERPGGIAQAMAAAEDLASGGPVVVLLADNVWERSLRPWVEAFERQGGGARVLLSRTEDPAALAQVAVPVWRDGLIRRIDEKPLIPASDFAVTGAYAFDEHVWDLLPSLKPSARGELEITDVLDCYAGRGDLEHDVIEGWWGDAGQSIDAYYRACDFVRRQEGP